MTSTIAYAEVRAALAAARRARRLSRPRLESARIDFERRWEEIDAIEADEALVRAAGEAAERFALRAGDAIHLASASFAGDVAVLTLDGKLRRAAAEAGIAAIPID